MLIRSASPCGLRSCQCSAEVALHSANVQYKIAVYPLSAFLPAVFCGRLLLISRSAVISISAETHSESIQTAAPIDAVGYASTFYALEPKTMGRSILLIERSLCGATQAHPRYSMPFLASLFFLIILNVARDLEPDWI